MIAKSNDNPDRQPSPSGKHAKNNNGWKATEATINRLAKKMVQECDEARRQKYRTDVAIYCMGKYRKQFVEDKTMGKADEALGQALLNALKNYNPDKGLFTHYLACTLKYRKKDHKDNGNTQGNQTICYMHNIEGDEYPIVDQIEDVSAQQPFECLVESKEMKQRINGHIVELLTLVTDFIENINDSRLSTQRTYTRLFFTETIARVTKIQDTESDCDPLCSHQTGIFKAMEVPFLDAFMLEKCRTILEIWHSPVKAGVTSDNRPDPVPSEPFPTKWRLSGRTYITYLENIRGEKSTNAKVSQQREHYEKLIGSIFPQAD